MSDSDRATNIAPIRNEPSPAPSSEDQKHNKKPGFRGADDCLSAATVDQFRKLARSKETTDDIAEELSAALGLAQRIRSRDLFVESAADRLQAIFDSLLADKPKLILARDERIRLQLDIYRQSKGITASLASISSGSPTALVLMALLASFVVWTSGVFGVLALAKGVSVIGVSIGVFKVDLKSLTIPSAVFFMDSKPLLVIVSAAFIGGVVSIGTRIREFSRIRDLDPFAMFWTAILKPLIGVILSVFLFATLAGGLISFGFLGDDPFVLKSPGTTENIIADKTLYILWVLGFLAGFSERFAWDFVDRAQAASTGGLGKNNPA
jgi:hypothetical protein